MTLLFISDLHLDPNQPELISRFCDFLANIACDANALYILGDLFEVWIGDDAIKQHQRVITALHTAAIKTPIYIMRGNRDFLLRKHFFEVTRTQPLPDYHCINLFGKPTLLMHGDLLCTDDHAYQKARRIAMQPWLQWVFLHLPYAARIKIANHLRQKSQRHTANTQYPIMDVNQTTVIETLKYFNVLQIIHGHTHRPKQHKLSINGTTAWRHVMGSWENQPNVLVCKPDDMRLVFF